MGTGRTRKRRKREKVPKRRHGGHRLNRLFSAHHERSDEAATRNRYISVRSRYKCVRNSCLVRACVKADGGRASVRYDRSTQRATSHKRAVARAHDRAHAHASGTAPLRP